MSRKRIICFGDSFTLGDGANLALTKEIENLFDKTPEGSSKASGLISEINKKLSWTQYVGDNLGVYIANEGESGANNLRIFNNVFNYEVGGTKYSSEDLVIIMWSSSIRNKLPWFPNVFSEAGPVGAGWSLKELLGKDAHRGFADRYYTVNSTENEKKYVDSVLSPFMAEYFKKYLTELHSEEFYNIVNLNLVVFIQEFFKSRNIPYLMIDAFERMDSFKSEGDDKWDTLVDKKHYLGFGETTLWDELNKIGGDIWEDKKLSYSPEGQRCHPNKDGYVLAGKIILDYINKHIWPKSLV